MARQEHFLKTWPALFEAVRQGDKTFEIRKDDRHFQKGDLAILLEWDPTPPANAQGYHYTNREQRFEITYVLRGGQFGLEPGYVALGLGLWPEEATS